jgi:hypothetical protein
MGVCTYIHVYMEIQGDPSVQECLELWLNDHYFYASSTIAGYLHDAIVTYRYSTKSLGITDYDTYDGKNLKITRDAIQSVADSTLHAYVVGFVTDALAFFPQSQIFYYVFYG